MRNLYLLMGAAQLIMGIAFIGARFTLIRTRIVLAFPCVAGLTVHFLPDWVETRPRQVILQAGGVR